MKRITENPRVRGNEIEPQPKVVLTFFGFNHHPYNLQVIPQMINSLYATFSNKQGERLFFKEGATASQNEKGGLINLAERYGFTHDHIGSAMHKRLKRKVALEEVYAVANALETETLFGILQKRLFDPNELLGYFMARELDKAKPILNFRYDMEHHTQGVINTAKLLKSKADRLANQSTQHVIDGDSKAAIEAYKQHLRLLGQANQLRNREIMEYLRSKIKDLEKKGGAIFMPFGWAHNTIAEDLQKSVEKRRGDVAIHIELTKSAKLHRQYDIDRFSNEYDDMTTSRMIIVDLFYELIFKKIQPTDDRIFYHFEDIETSVLQTAFALPEDTVMRICNGDISLLQSEVGEPALATK